MKTEEKVEELSTAPVHEGETITVAPSGMAKEDPFYSYHGYIIFLKGIPPGLEHAVSTFRIYSTKPNYAFAQHVK